MNYKQRKKDKLVREMFRFQKALGYKSTYKNAKKAFERIDKYWEED